ncbi:MAG TPA: histidine phosphatase family protein [Rhizobacter sp.]|nr:histidine phosphatase family protein [Rhizobacter sp.]
MIVWRHPRPDGVAGRCIGRSDVPVDPRKAKRLAHRIRQRARREGLPRVVWTSPLWRSASVGRWLARWGWRHGVDTRLSELDFGDWDGRTWASIGHAQVALWVEAFATHAPGGGESVSQLMARCQAFLAEHGHVCVVSHAGWINAAQRVLAGLPPPTAADWPAPVAYSAAVELRRSAAGAESQ